MKKRAFIIGLEVTKLSHQIVRALEAQIIASVDKNMSATTARIICIVMEEGAQRDIYQKDIEKLMGLNRSSVSLILNKMEGKGLIRRQCVAEDARLKKIEPTELALRYHKQITRAFDKVEDKMKEGLPDLSAFADALAQIKQNLEQ